MSKKLEKLADEMMRLTPQEGEQLALIIKAKVMGIDNNKIRKAVKSTKYGLNTAKEASCPRPKIGKLTNIIKSPASVLNNEKINTAFKIVRIGIDKDREAEAKIPLFFSIKYNCQCIK